MAADYYKALGVEETANQDEIKKAYRKLAKQYHPDRHKGDKKAEARFKEISEAYSTIGDDSKRQEYDMIRKYGGGMGGGPYAGGGFGPGGGFDPREFDFSQFKRSGPGGGSQGFESFGGFGDLDDVLSSFFGGGGRARHGGAETFRRGGQQSRTQRGADLTAELSIAFMESVNGTQRQLTLSGSSKKLNVKIPAGIEDGGKIRLKGQGQPAFMGGENGDLIITVRVMSDQQFERKGNDIYSSVEVSFVEAIKGCKKNVKTLTKTVALNIPPGTQPGTVMRLKGMGLAVGGANGDQYVEIKVTIPKTLTDDQKKLLDEWEG